MQAPAGCRDPFEIRGVEKVGAAEGSPVNPFDDQYATLGQVTGHIRPHFGTGRGDGIAVFRLAIDLEQRAVLRGDPDDDLTPTMRNHPVVAVGQAARQRQRAAPAGELAAIRADRAELADSRP
jgi:hypothetical protein